MIDAGIGETHVNNLLTALDIPPVCHKSLKKSERVVGTALERMAHGSCKKNLEEECRLTIGDDEDASQGIHVTATSNTMSCTSTTLPAISLTPKTLAKYKRRLQEGYDIPDESYEAWKAMQERPSETTAEVTSSQRTVDDHTSRGVGVTVAYDMGWAKRGRAMNSLTGVGTNIGARTGKVVGYATRSKRCITCEVAKRKKRPPREHDCRHNHTGSSKSMEPAVAVELAKDLENHGARLACLVGDDDASTYKRVVEEIGDVQKHSDIGHAKRGLGSKLIDIKQKNKNCKQLSSTVITYFQKMFAYALQSNAGDPDGLESTLLAVVPHAYGDHAQCSSSWCGFLKAPEGYKHGGLPYGKDLSCSDTKVAVSDLFTALAAQSAKLSPLGSSQSNESFNNIATSKAPKTRHYGGSESQDFRIAAAVLPKNEGHTYVAQTSVEAGLSPSRQALHRGTQIDASRSKQKSHRSTRSAKLRRKVLREQRGKVQEVCELREGTSYQSSCALIADSLDTEEIPPPQKKPDAAQLSSNSGRDVVVVDVETTGLSRTSHITQIAATVLGSDEQFSRYMLPCERISDGATATTGLAIIFEDGRKRLALNGKVVESCSQKEGLSDFIEWLESRGRSCVLVAHNCLSFDMRVLVNAAIREGLLADLEEWVDGFCDSLPLMKSALPSMTTYKLSSLYEDQFNDTFTAHDAMADVVALDRLLVHCKCDVQSSAITMSSAVDIVQFAEATSARSATFADLVKKKVLSKAMAEKAAASGLQYGHLILAHRRDAENGIAQLFKEQTGTGRRVTASTRIIKSVIDHLSK